MSDLRAINLANLAQVWLAYSERPARSHVPWWSMRPGSNALGGNRLQKHTKQGPEENKTALNLQEPCVFCPIWNCTMQGEVAFSLWGKHFEKTRTGYFRKTTKGVLPQVHVNSGLQLGWVGLQICWSIWCASSKLELAFVRCMWRQLAAWS